MSDHGTHFDNFRAQSGSPHGGAEYDAGFGTPTAATDGHGEHFDEFARRAGVDKHGERWDEFGWRDLPVLHGNRFDEGFASPVALAGDVGHGTWFDTFRGGTQLRYLADGGAEYEGTVIDLESDHAKVERKDGTREEVGLGQILQWRDGVATDSGPSRREVDKPAPGMPQDAAQGGQIAALNTESIGRSDAEAPSAHSATAAGGGARESIDPQMERPFITLKTVGEVYDVGKLQVTGKAMANAVEQHRTNIAHVANGEAQKAKCPSCGDHHSYNIGHTPGRGAKMGTSKMFGSCTECKFRHTFPAPKIKAAPAKSKLAGSAPISQSVASQVPTVAQAKRLAGKTDDASPVDVAKTVDSSETAVQGDAEKPSTSEGKAWCSTCKHYCREVKDGKCPTCGGSVTVKKFTERALDVVKMLRDRAGV